MKIFQTVQRHYAILGISSSNQLNELCKIVLFFFTFGCSIVLQFLYIFRVANGFMDYVEGICMTSSSIITFVSFSAIVFKKPVLFECIDNIERLINKSKSPYFQIVVIELFHSKTEIILWVLGYAYPKSDALFLKTNLQVEQLCEFIFTLLVKILLQIVMLPKCIGSFGVYFFTDSGRDSFELPIPSWYDFYIIKIAIVLPDVHFIIQLTYTL